VSLSGLDIHVSTMQRYDCEDIVSCWIDVMRLLTCNINRTVKHHETLVASRGYAPKGHETEDDSVSGTLSNKRHDVDFGLFNW
jgi:hypothetical protein